MEKNYYYYVQVSTVINCKYRGVLYFKAKNKKQIKHYLKLNHIEAHSKIFDPTINPVDGIIYIDVTNLKPPTATASV